uniref:C-type lectin domain-containing protein n=1 Tax=Branchiostoma floridae TaxID=7739 RepID=C3ZY57_BRAFL|eukprot:XP_002586528.1 hypothetical protein BRAFLDRAFT_106427 [Branchiostoma floridae]
MRQLYAAVDALKHHQDGMRQLYATVDALKHDRDDMRQLSTTFDALKRDQDNIRQLSTTVDTLKYDLDKERSQTAALEQRLHEMSKTSASCPNGYTTLNGICYKAFYKKKTFSDAAAACGEDGGTLAMPRDAETNGFLISLYKSVIDDDALWFGLHDQVEEGSISSYARLSQDINCVQLLCRPFDDQRPPNSRTIRSCTSKQSRSGPLFRALIAAKPAGRRANPFLSIRVVTAGVSVMATALLTSGKETKKRLQTRTKKPRR